MFKSNIWIFCSSLQFYCFTESKIEATNEIDTKLVIMFFFYFVRIHINLLYMYHGVFIIDASAHVL